MSNNVSVERAILHSILVDFNNYYAVAEYLKPFHFSVPQHKVIFRTVDTLAQKGTEVGLLTLTSFLEKNGELESAGGKDYLEDIYSEEFPEDELKTLVDVVVSDYVERESAAVGYSLLQWSKQKDREPIESHITQAISQLDELVSGGGGTHTEHIKDILREEWESLRDRFETPGISGYSTLFENMDTVMSGFNPSDLILVAARPSMGKTSLVLRMILNLARQGIPSMLFSYEMSRKQLSQRMVAMETGLNLLNLRQGRVSNEELINIKDTYQAISSYPIFIDSNMSASLGYVLSTARRYVRHNDVKVIFIDYLQLMISGENETAELGRISRALKMLAMELNVAIVAVSQLNRNLESRENKRPQLSDLRQSGRLEEDADIVQMLYRPAAYTTVVGDKEHLMEILFRKNRNGPIGTVSLYFDRESTNVVSSLGEILNKNAKLK